MSHDNERLIGQFGAQPSRRMLLQGLIALGVGSVTLDPLARALAASSDAEVASLTVMSQGGPVVDVLKELAAPMFAKAHPDTGVDIEVSSATVTYPKMQATRNDPVIAGGMFNDLFTARGIVDKMWAKLDPANMPNAQRVPNRLKGEEGFDIAFQQTPFGIMYNPDKVEKPTSWNDLYKPDYKGRVSLWATNMDCYAMAGVAAGKGFNVQAGIEAWKPHKANIGAWVTSPVAEEDLVAQGEIWLAPHWGAWAEQARSLGKKVAFTIPKEGGTLWSNHACVSASMPNRKTALTEIYLDTWFSEEVQTAWLRKTFVAPTLPSVKIPAGMMSNPAILPADEMAKLYRIPAMQLARDFRRDVMMITQELKE